MTIRATTSDRHAALVSKLRIHGLYTSCEPRGQVSRDRRRPISCATSLGGSRASTSPSISGASDGAKSASVRSSGTCP